MLVTVAISLVCLAAAFSSVSAARLSKGSCSQSAFAILSSLGIAGPYSVTSVPGQPGSIVEVTGTANGSAFGFDFTGDCNATKIEIRPTSGLLRLRQPAPGIVAVIAQKRSTGYDVDVLSKSGSARRSFRGDITLLIVVDRGARHLVVSHTGADGLGAGLISPLAILSCSGTPRFASWHFSEEGSRGAEHWSSCN